MNISEYLHENTETIKANETFDSYDPQNESQSLAKEFLKKFTELLIEKNEIYESQ